MDLSLLALCGFAFLAGFIDAVVGGGGLVQVPALFVLHPELSPATLFGTNKFASVFGTANASWQYSRRVQLPWKVLGLTMLTAFAFSFLGARTISLFNPALLRPLILMMMIAVFAYTLWKKDFGSLHAPKLSERHQFITGFFVGAAIGFYDGFFGPGTGSFLIFAFVGLFGFSFLVASAAAKLVNFSTNLAALAWFIPHGQVMYRVALPMAACNIAGSYIGSQLAIRKGSGFVRQLFIVIVAALIARMAFDIWRAA
ncbi:MAG: TSUP family transporter [Stagnimonas sp.]|nr:TSUP family transporter [Stagnimonas sp.]